MIHIRGNLGGLEYAPPSYVHRSVVAPSRFYPMERSFAIRLGLYAHRQENSNLLLPAEGWKTLLSTGKDDNRELLLQVERTVA